MLLTLRIQDFVLIDEIELRLEPGYNVVTGETGAGKSILVGALNLVLGGRSRADLVRPGAREAIIEALFDIHGDEALETRLQEAGIECGGELLIRRVVQKNGRSRAYMNGRMCTISELSALALSLADVTSQHESVALNDPSRHIDYLDRYAGLTKERESLAHVVDELNETLHALRALAQREQSRGEREDFLRFQLDQIDTLDPQPGELDELEGQRQRLQHARRLGELTGGVLRTLDGQASWSGAYGGDNDDPNGGQDPLCDRLARLNADLGAAAELDSSLSPVAEELEDCWSRLRDVATELAAYSGQLQSDPDALEQVQERLFALQDLMRKHGPTLNEVLSVREQLSEELSALDHGDEQRRDLDTNREKLARVATDRARKLSRKRRRAARNLGKAITTQLQNLGMGSARVLVEVSPTPTHGGPTSHHAEPSLVVDGGHLGRHGVDRVELLIAPNKGLDPRPLARIASGGELARALLAVKRVLGGYEGTSTPDGASRTIGVQVFDEVDTGVGGVTADKIGRCIADISCHRQVLCITHLAAIAASAEAHFVVSKYDEGKTTTSRIERIEAKQRVTEIGRMLTGETTTRASQKAAAEMIAAASSARDERRANQAAAAE